MIEEFLRRRQQTKEGGDVGKFAEGLVGESVLLSVPLSGREWHMLIMDSGASVLIRGTIHMYNGEETRQVLQDESRKLKDAHDAYHGVNEVLARVASMAASDDRATGVVETMENEAAGE